jgi:DNA polymerase V
MAGDAMVDADINDNDILVAHPIVRPQNGSIIVALVEGNMVVRRYFCNRKRICLVPENVNYPATEISQNESLEIFGGVF